MDGKVALITGSTAGIGKAIAHALAARKCHVIIHGRRPEDQVTPLLEKIKQDFQVEASYLQLDLGSLEEIPDACRKLLAKHGQVDILVNNAGYNHASGLADVPLEKWQDMMNVMVTAPFLLTQHLLPPMKTAGWGRIINMGSVFSHTGWAQGPIYTTAKHAILGFTKSVALEVAGSGVTCNVICPGIVPDTELASKALQSLQTVLGLATYEETLANVLEKAHPTKQPVLPEQVGETAAFLCSPAADQMTGTSINIDGGAVAR